MSTPSAPASTGVPTDEARAAHGPSGASGRRSLPGERARRAVIQGAKAGGLAGAALAAGVFLEARTKLSRKLPLSRRPTRTRAIRHAIAKRRA
jgi:hypothetical protein